MRTIGSSQRSGEPMVVGSKSRVSARLVLAAWSAVVVSCTGEAIMGPEGAGASQMAPGTAAATPPAAGAAQPGAAAVPPSMANNPPAAPPSGAAAAAPAGAPDAAVTYHKSIRPIIQQRCIGCHFDGGAATAYPLTDWTMVQGLASSVVAKVMTREMPPWLADASPADCVKLADDQRLSDEQLAMFAEWQTLGFPEGVATDYVEPAPRAAVKLGAPSMLIQSAQPQRLTQNWEEYVPTPMQANFAEDTYVIALDVKPETESVVHHAIVSIGGCTALGPGNIYSYRPGSSTVVFGDDSAMLIPAGSTLCTQFHYNTKYMAEIPAMEHSTLRLWTMPAGQRPKYLITRHPNHIMALSIPPGVVDRDFKSMISAGSALNPPANVNRASAQIVGLSPHMHALGVKFSETLFRADGSKVCLMNVPRWDWEWQIDYMFAEPLVPQASDRIEQICTYSNTPEQQLLDENGQPLTPRLTTFGEGTRDEMCLGYIWMRYETM